MLQALLWFRQERIELPAASYVDGRHGAQWKPPGYNTLLHILTNPDHASAYAFGRADSRSRIDAGRKRVVRSHRRSREDRQSRSMNPALRQAARSAGIERRGHYAPRSFPACDTFQSARDGDYDQHCV